MHTSISGPVDTFARGDRAPPDASAGAWRRPLSSAWAAWQQARRARADMRLLLELSPRALDDMGAPDWLRHQAASHQAAQALRRRIDGQGRC